MLHLASRNGHLKFVKLLLRNKADVNRRNASGKTSLHIAAEMGHADIVRTLMDHEGEVNAVDKKGNTALHLAARRGHIAVVNVLLNLTTKIHEQISSQLEENHISADEFAISQNSIRPTNGVNVGRPSHFIPEDSGNAQIDDAPLSELSMVIRQATPVHFVAEHAHENLTFSGASVNARNEDKMTPLHLACQNGHTSVVVTLLESHAAADVRAQEEQTPFWHAVKNGHADVTELLLSRGVSSFQKSGITYETPLHIAIERNHTKVVEVILRHIRIAQDKITKDGTEHEENSKRATASVELLTIDGRCISAEIVWTEGVRNLQINKYNTDVFQYTVSPPMIETKAAQLLLSLHHFMNSETSIADWFRSIVEVIPPFHLAINIVMQNVREMAQLLIKSSKFNVNHQEYRLNNTILHKYCSRVCYSSESHLTPQILIQLTQLLLEKGADFNLKNSFGETPLMIASENGRCDFIQILFDWEKKSETKLDLDARDQHGATALIKAAENHQVSVVRLLINHGACVNLYDYKGFTALHAVLHDPNWIWFDLHFFFNGLCQQRCRPKRVKYLQIDHRNDDIWRHQRADKVSTIRLLKITLNHRKKATRNREEIVKLLLTNNETNVNAIDFRQNTPLDLAVKSSKQITAATFDALRSRGAISNFLEDEAPIHVERVDKRGRNPLHRLAISIVLYTASLPVHILDTRRYYRNMVNTMVDGSFLRPTNCINLVTATDGKGRTPLHYAIMRFVDMNKAVVLIHLMLKLGSNVNAADMYGRTPLHYTKNNTVYKCLVQSGADENKKDKDGHTPKDLWKLRDLMFINERNATKSTIGSQMLYLPVEVAQRFDIGHVNELKRRKVVEVIRIYPHQLRTELSAEETVWQLYADGDFIRLNRRLERFKPYIQQFIERLANGIKERDERFECQPILVGSANEETKIVISGDFDFNFKLNKFSQLCDAFSHPLGPKGYFQLRWKSNIPKGDKSPGFAKFASFFNFNQCLLTNEVNSRFQIILEEVLLDQNFWKDEYLFEMLMTDYYGGKPESPAGLYKRLLLSMIRPIEDGECEFLFINISVDIVACVHVDSSCFQDPVEVGSSPLLNTAGFSLVFDRPRIDPSKPVGAGLPFSETYTRISFAPQESRIIKESPPILKAAYMVCKMITFYDNRINYKLKTCLLFCIEAFNAINGSEASFRCEHEITSKQLYFWVERIMFCFMEFSRHHIYPCYFMSSFKQPCAELICDTIIYNPMKEGLLVSLKYSKAFDYYRDLCPDDTAIDIAIIEDLWSHIENPNATPNPTWEQFDREEFIRRLSSRDPCC